MPHSSPPLRVLLLADSHLGFDLPVRPRVERRRRGHDFLANHERALAPAKAGDVDLVVHGGDVFHRPRVAPSLVYQAFRPLLEVAESGIPVVVVPGNHERSRIPHAQLTIHPNIHIFRRPETIVLDLRGLRIALAGFPYLRRRVRERFPRVLEETGWRRQEADVRLLVFHHCVEGATVGPSDYTFRGSHDVVRCTDLPGDFAAVLSGHIHRYQRLDHDLQGKALPAPVLYPGSVERTAFAEMEEEKGFLLLDLEPDQTGGKLLGSHFVPLPARPMVLRDLHSKLGANGRWQRGDLRRQLASTLDAMPKDAVLRIRVHGDVPPQARRMISATHIRRVAPPDMNLEITLTQDHALRQAAIKRSHSASSSRGPSDPGTPGRLPQMEMDFLGAD